MQPHKQNLVLGAIVGSTGYLFVALMGACSKLVSQEISTAAILFAQNILCLILILPQAIKHGLPGLKTKRLGLHLFRDITGVASFFSLFFTLKSIPLIDGILLQNTAPLWIPLILLIWLRIKMNVHLWWGMILGFIGILLILKPGSGVLTTASWFGVASGIFLAISRISTRRLTITEPTYRILFFYFLFGTLITAPFAFTEGLTQLSGKDLLLLVGVGIFMFISQILITYSFRHGKASTFAPIAYSAVVYSGILGWLIWGHIPDLLSFIGLFLVIIGGILSIFFEKKNEKKLASKRL